AVRIMPMARFSPICRGRRCKPPASAARPTRGSGRAKVAFSEAMIRSQASATSKPPPIATPLTAAMIGLSQSKRVVRPEKPPFPHPRLPPAACHFKSLPAQNALSPAPVTMATHCSGSAAKSSNTLFSSKCASICSALYTSGRDSVTIVIGPLRVTWENFRSMFAPVDFFLRRGVRSLNTNVLPPSGTTQLRKGPAHHKLIPLLRVLHFVCELRGPITTDFCCCRSRLPTSQNEKPPRMGPRVREDDEGNHPRATRSFSFCALIDSRAWVQSASDQSRN